MLNSAAYHSKTARAPERAPCCGTSNRGKGSMQGHSLRYRRTCETSRNAVEGQLLGADEHTAWHVTLILVDVERLSTLGSRSPLRLDLPEAFGWRRVPGLSWEKAT